MMDNELMVNYDELADKMDVKVKTGSSTVKLMVQKDLYIELDEQSGEMIGYTIFEYSQNSHKNRGWAQMLREIPQKVRELTTVKTA